MELSVPPHRVTGRGLGPNLTGGSNRAETTGSALAAIRQTQERHPAGGGVGTPPPLAGGRHDGGLRAGDGTDAHPAPRGALVGAHGGTIPVRHPEGRVMWRRFARWFYG